MIGEKYSKSVDLSRRMNVERNLPPSVEAGMVALITGIPASSMLPIYCQSGGDIAGDAS